MSEFHKNLLNYYLILLFPKNKVNVKIEE